MILARLRLPALALLAFAACAAPDSGSEPPPVAAATVAKFPSLWNFDDAAAGIRAASCTPGDTTEQAAAALELAVQPLNAKQLEVLASRMPAGASVFGAWELSATDPNFGGLSDIAFTGKDNIMMAVTDAGAWVTLALGEAGPSEAGISYMRSADGTFLSGKSEGDAEGLAMRGGLAFVSFERDFRIEAFDVAGCGAAAKAVPVSSLPASHEGRQIDPNAGPEALTLTPQGSLIFGYEGVKDGISPLGRIMLSGEAEWGGSNAPNPKGFALVAMDAARLADGKTRDIFLYRSFDPFRGARAILTWGPDEEHRISLSRPVLTDNFEGLTTEILPDGRLRLWIISDDNFSDMQRTLLYAFYVTP